MELRQCVYRSSMDNACVLHSKVSQAWNLCRHVQIHSLHFLQVLHRVPALYHRVWTWILLSTTKSG